MLTDEQVYGFGNSNKEIKELYWCEPCKSYHVDPKDFAHWKALECKKPFKEITKTEIKISIEGAHCAPSWELLQEFINSILDTEGLKLTKIDRADKGVNYKEKGKYLLKAENKEAGNEVNIELTF